MLLNTDGHAWDILVILSALVGSTEDMARIKRVADSGNKRAKEILSFISTFYEEIEVKK
jgi:ERCC4-type nuclease